MHGWLFQLVSLIRRHVSLQNNHLTRETNRPHEGRAGGIKSSFQWAGESGDWCCKAHDTLEGRDEAGL